MKKGTLDLSLISRLIGVIIGMIGFGIAGFVDQRVGGILIAIGAILIALPVKW